MDSEVVKPMHLCCNVNEKCKCSQCLYSNEYHRFQTFKKQLQGKFQSLEDELTGFIKKATKSIEEAKNKPQFSQLHADVEYSDEDDIGSPERRTRNRIICDFILLLLKLFDLTNKGITKEI